MRVTVPGGVVFSVGTTPVTAPRRGMYAPSDKAPIAPTAHCGSVNAMVPMRADTIVVKAVADTLVSAVGKLRTVRVPGDGGRPVTKPDRKRSPVGPEFATCSTAVPGGGGVAVMKASVKGEAAVAVAVSVAALGVTLTKVPLSAGPRPIKPPRSIGKRATV